MHFVLWALDGKTTCQTLLAGDVFCKIPVRLIKALKKLGGSAVFDRERARQVLLLTFEIG